MSLQSEHQILGALIKKNSLFQVCDLVPEEFENENNAEIFGAISTLIGRDIPADMVTVYEHLLRETGRNYIDLLNTVHMGALETSLQPKYFTEHTRMVRESFKRRKALGIVETLRYELTERKNFDAIDTAISSLMQIEKSQRKYSHTLDECVLAALEMVEEAFEKDGMVGVPTGLKDLDENLGGFHDTDLIVIGARPAMGKTALLLNFANSAGKPVGICSGEQGGAQVGLRFISIVGDMDSQKLRTAKLSDGDWAHLTATVSALKGRSIYVNDEPSPSIATIKRQAREWKYRYNIAALYVDYIQKIKGSDTSKSKTEQVTEVVEDLKSLAKELDIPVVALAQVKREVESRGGRPGMGDMSDASAIEKEADVIMTLYRDEVYNPDSPDKGKAEIDVCKNRHGPIGIVPATFIGKFMQFKDLAPNHYREDE